MQKIKDERLLLENLKNIRVAYIIQTLGILGILAWELMNNGMEGMTSNPLWFVFIVTVVVSIYLSMNISVAHEKEKRSPGQKFTLSLVVLTVISIGLGALTAMSEGFDIWNGLLIGGIGFGCGLAPIVYIYNLRKKEAED